MITFNFELHDLASVAVAVACGACIGMEREYKSKFAGFRTIVLICLGSAVFMILSQQITLNSPDRIASNIVTGIGFIGAGVIFRDRSWVKGLTTAAVIWVSSAIGMICGTGNYLLAVIVTVIAVLVLSVFSLLEEVVDAAHQRKQMTIRFKGTDLHLLYNLETAITNRQLKARRLHIQKEQDEMVAILVISGNRKKLLSLNEYMVTLAEIRSFETI